MEPRFVTVLVLPEGAEDEVRRLFETIRDRDPTWIWELKHIEGETKVVIYSQGKNQAKGRGEWLTKNTDLFRDLPYETTHNLTLRTILKEKPSKVEGLRARLKRDRIWKEASRARE